MTEYCLLGVCLPAEAWAAWVQAVGTIAAIAASAAFAIGVPYYQARERREKHRKALITLLDGVLEEIRSQLFWVETGGREGAAYTPGAFLNLAQLLDRFPVAEVGDPGSLKDVAEVSHHLRVMVGRIERELSTPRKVWELLQSYRHNVWQRSIWIQKRFGWAVSEEPIPNRLFGTDPQLMRLFTWDEDGNPTMKPFPDR